MTTDAAAMWARRMFPHVSWAESTSVSGAFHTVVIGPGHVARVSRGRDHLDRADRERRSAVVVSDAFKRRAAEIEIPQVLTELRSDGGYSGYLLSRLPASDEPPSDWAVVRPTFQRLLDLLATSADDMPLPPARSWCGGESWLQIVTDHLAPLLEDDAGVAEAAARAVLDLPPTAATLVHGDLGPHNILWRGARASALIDWDHACVGDPAIDIAPLIGLYGAERVRDVASAEVVTRAMHHRSTLPLQVAAAAHTVGDHALRDHALTNFRNRLRDGVLYDPRGERP